LSNGRGKAYIIAVLGYQRHDSQRTNKSDLFHFLPLFFFDLHFLPFHVSELGGNGQMKNKKQERFDKHSNWKIIV
jgi:hypothetical protein